MELENVVCVYLRKNASLHVTALIIGFTAYAPHLLLTSIKVLKIIRYINVSRLNASPCSEFSDP